MFELFVFEFIHKKVMLRKIGAVLLVSIAIAIFVFGFSSISLAKPQNNAVNRERYETGRRTLEQVTGVSGSQVVESLQGIAPDLADWIIEFAYGDVFSRPALDFRSRQLVTVAALTAMGNATPQLKVHINGALNVGCKPEEIVEAILQMSVYAGFPASINGINVAREVFQERGIKVIEKKSK